MSHSEVKARCMKAMNESGRVGSDDAAIQHGLNFYKYLFEHQPSVRVYFKGAENFSAEDVQNSDRFAKQGNSYFPLISNF
ncbi:Globin-like protein [Dirofilaria immitis]